MSVFIEDLSLFFGHFIWDWWWIFVPPAFFVFAKRLYLWYKHERYYRKVPWIMLEIRLPELVEKTPKAMESVLTGLHAIYDPPTWRDKWFEGRTLLWSLSLEIVSIDGVVHFYVYVPKAFRSVVESNIYAEYPQAEIFEAEDYTKKIPQDIPNKNWDFWGTDLVMKDSRISPIMKDAKVVSIFPLRTYPSFETEMTVEEKRIDPLSSMLELMSSLQVGEQLWIQILLRPIADEKLQDGLKLREAAEKFGDKIMGKEEKKGGGKKSFLGPIGEFFEVVGGGLIGVGPTPLPPQQQRMDPLLWRLSPGQQDLLKAVEAKILKPYFQANIRFIYLGENEVFSRPRGVAGTFGVFKQFNGYNTLSRPDKITKTKVVFFMVNRRTYFRKKRLLRFYMRRWFPRHRPLYVLNTEEVATMYHFPGRMVAPAPFVPRIIAKKGEPPPVLPTG